MLHLITQSSAFLVLSMIFITKGEDKCTPILPSWPGNHIPESSIWPTNRSARSTKCGGGECACEEGGQGLLLVDCSRAESPKILENGLESNPREVRIVIMGSELTSLESLGNTQITRAHFKYNPGLSYISPKAFIQSHDTLLVLDLRNNNLSSPLNFEGNFNVLQFLSLDDNVIEEVPEWILKSTTLVHLSLANNFVSVINDLSKLQSLQFLNLHNNKFKQIPTGLELPKLRSLVLQGNPITTIAADSFKHLHSLEYLDLSHSKLNSLPTKSLLTPTTRPWFLSLAHTPIVELPSDGFSALWVDLRGTKISSLNEVPLRPILSAMAAANVVHADWGRPQLWLHNDALSCDCSTKWLATNASLVRHISGRCNDKHIQMRFLDPDYFNVFCF